jgi:hypothetical protein
MVLQAGEGFFQGKGAAEKTHPAQGDFVLRAGIQNQREERLAQAGKCGQVDSRIAWRDGAEIDNTADGAGLRVEDDIAGPQVSVTQAWRPLVQVLVF